MGADYHDEKAASLMRQIIEYAGKLAHQEAKIAGLKEQIADLTAESNSLQETIRGLLSKKKTRKK